MKSTQSHAAGSKLSASAVRWPTAVHLHGLDSIAKCTFPKRRVSMHEERVESTLVRGAAGRHDGRDARCAVQRR
eukprot:2653282-Pleurochrysis_carterae.AAC.3